MKKFKIPFVGLKPGNHHFEYEIDAAYWKNWENPPVTESDLKVELELQKTSLMMVLYFDIFGTIKSTCDRCLDNLDFPLKTSGKIIVKFGEAGLEQETDELVILPPNEFELDVSQWIYEFTLLGIPMRITHPDGSEDCAWDAPDSEDDSDDDQDLTPEQLLAQLEELTRKFNKKKK